MSLALLHFGGKHAAFVWAAYAVTAPVLAGLVIESLLRARYWRRKAEGRATRTPPDQGQP